MMVESGLQKFTELGSNLGAIQHNNYCVALPFCIWYNITLLGEFMKNFFNIVANLFKYIFLLAVLIVCVAFLILGVGLAFGVMISLVKFGYILGSVLL